MKREMQSIKPSFFLLLMVSGADFNSKKNRGSGNKSPRIQIPDPGKKKH
jgi:hypothetical protein